MAEAGRVTYLQAPSSFPSGNADREPLPAPPAAVLSQPEAFGGTHKQSLGPPLSIGHAERNHQGHRQSADCS